MYRNRGKLPDISPNKGGEKGNGGYRAPHYRNYWPKRFLIITYDSKFLAIELISVFIILVIMFAAYIFSYKIEFNDPIESIKNNYLIAQIILIVITIFATVLVTMMTKSNKENLILNLRLIATVSILIIAILFGAKVYLDNQYKNESVFAEFYEQYEKGNQEDSKKITVGLTGTKMQTPQETYIENSLESYNVFSIKSIIYMAIYILFVVLIFYLAHRLAIIEDIRDEVIKNDDVLFDDEENVKF